jgi:glycosyltransferase involved in cell wall biosynthesis
MNILYIINSGRPGGMEQHTLDLVKGMVGNGHKVWVWCAEGPINNWFREAGAEVIIRTPAIEIDPVYIYGLLKFLKKEKIDVVHAHEVKVGVNALIAAKLAGVKVRITHTHTPISTWQIDERKKKINILVNTFFVNWLADREIALTASRKKIKMSEGIKEDKLAVIPNALDTVKFYVTAEEYRAYREEIRNRYHIPEDAFVFGNLSRITEEKGHDILVEAFRGFLEFAAAGDAPVYLLIAGGGKLEEKLRQQTEELGIKEKVIITGVFEAEDLIKFYAAFDAFIFPSRAEGFGIVLIEAMYSKLPVICSDLEVLQEVGGSTVIFFEDGNARDLSDKMNNLYLKRDRFEALVEGAHQRVLDLYSMEKFVKNYNDLYLNIFEDKRKG